MAIKKISANLLGSNAVLAANIAGGAISAADIADNSITAAKISVSTSPTFGALNVNGLLDINTSGAHLKFTRSSFDTLQFGTGTGNSISGLHLTNTTDSTVPFSIDENAPNGSLTIDSQGNLQIKNTADNGLTLNKQTASTWNYIEYKNQGTRSHYIGTDSAGKLIFGSDSGAIFHFTGGSVGIGTTAPQSNLEVNLHSGSDSSLMNANSVNDVYLIRAGYGQNAATTSNAEAKWGLRFVGRNDGTYNNGKSGAIYAVSEDSAGYNRKTGLAFHTSSFDAAHSERMRIDADGNVIIGTTSAGSGKLTINSDDAGETGAGGILLQTANSAMRIGGTNGRSWIQSHASQPLYLNKLGNNVILNGDGAGNVGIGTTSVSAKLHVAGSIKGTDLIAHDSGGLAFQTDEGTKRISILDSGNVVIGDNSLIGTKPTGSALNIFGDGVTLRLDGGSNSTKTILFRGTSSGNPGEIYADGGLRFRTEDAGMPITFHTNSTGTNNLRMTIDGTGGVTFNTGSITINNSSTYQIRSATSGSVLRGAAVHHLITHDHRTPTYASMTHGHMGFGFTSYALNNSSPWADIIYLNSYTDSSGGSPNAIVVSRSASNCKVVRYDWSNTSSTAISNGTQYALAGSTSSDQRLKENVQNITNGLDIIKALRPVTFNWTDEFLQAGLSKNESEIEADENGTLIAPETKVENVGLIAQEVEEVLPTIIHENEISFGGTDYKTIHYDKLVPHLIAAIKELEARVAELEG